MKLVTPFAWLYRFKGKIIGLIALVCVFSLLLFPTQDLRDLVTIQVYERSGRSIFVLFNKIHVGIFPPHLSLEDLRVSGRLLPGQLSATKVKLTPFSDVLITQTPAGELLLEGLWSGTTLVRLEPGRTLESGVKSQLLRIQADQVSLSELASLVKLPVKLSGQGQLLASGQIDPSFQSQPDFDFDLQIKELELPSSQVETMMGPLNLPSLKVSNAQIKGRWSAGRIQFERIQLGQLQDELSAEGKGFLGLALQPTGGRLTPSLGGYQFEFDLRVTRDLESRAGLFFVLLDPYKSAITDGSRFRFKISGNNMMAPPNFGPMN